MIKSYNKLGKQGQVICYTTANMICNVCSREYVRAYSKIEKYQDNNFDYCSPCWSRRPEQRNKMSKRLKQYAKDHPEWLEKKSQSMKGKNLGSKNGMAKPENQASRDRVSEAMKSYYSDETHRINAAQYAREAWANGVYDGVAVGKCKWYEHNDWQGNSWKVQGTWELAYAKYLDAKQINYKAHRDRFAFIDTEGNERSYYPDFLLIDENVYIDIKNDYHYQLSKEKFKSIRKSNPDLDLKILLKEDLYILGVQV